MKKYPIIGSIKLLKIKKCKICNKDSIRKAVIENNIFRGDDDVFCACEECFKKLKNGNFEIMETFK
jgi:hypothetical protein